MTAEQQIRNHASLIWSVADKLRGVYKQSEYGRVILPLVVLRRLDCVLEPTKAEVLARNAGLKGRVENVGPVLETITGIREVTTRAGSTSGGCSTIRETAPATCARTARAS